MPRSLRAALLALSLSGILAPVQAADPDVTATVLPVPDFVTLSRPTAVPSALTYYAAYEVKIINNSTNVLNNVRLVAHSVVVGALDEPLPNLSAPFVPDTLLSPNCVTVSAPAGAPANARGIACSLGQLRGGGGAASTSAFTVIFEAPAAGATVKLVWTAYFGEGGTDTPGASHVDFRSGTALTTLGTPQNESVKSFVRSGGGALFTGADGVARPGDTWTTRVVIPSSAKAEVVENTVLTPLAPNLYDLSSSTLTIPGQFPDKLKIYLRRDASTILKGAKIDNAIIYYDRLAAGPIAYPYAVLPCSDTSLGSLPKPGIPCINSRTAYTKRTAPTPEWEGDWQFEIWALDNGKYAN